ncbi:hypothetical protein A7Q26_03620 [Sphingobium sp. TCM1]|nr:hypothetical protein A7Q26_03620 [Sphingobium sp. TCM1]
MRFQRIVGFISLGYPCFDQLDRILYCFDLTGGFIRDSESEFVFKRHHNFQHIETIHADVIVERRSKGNLIRIDAELTANDPENSGSDFFHHKALARTLSARKQGRFS